MELRHVAALNFSQGQISNPPAKNYSVQIYFRIFKRSSLCMFPIGNSFTLSGLDDFWLFTQGGACFASLALGCYGDCQVSNGFFQFIFFSFIKKRSWSFPVFDLQRFLFRGQ